MSAAPITPDPYIAAAALHLQQLNADLARTEDSGLSRAEREFLPEANARPWKPKGLPVAEIDCDLRIPGQGEIAVTLAVWGTFHKARKGYAPKGERQIEPDEPAHFEVDTVMMGDVDVTAELGQPGEEAIAAYCMENCEEDTPPEPEPHFCEDRR